MLDRARILGLIPHQGAMCLLDRVLRWDAAKIVCQARSHLDPANPLRRGGRLGPVAGIEYGLQAAALHGALRAGDVPQPAGRLVVLRGVTLHVPRLDDPALGLLEVTAMIECGTPDGVAYAFCLSAEDGGAVLEGRCLIALPGPLAAEAGRTAWGRTA
jgi:predicted hotdog family 3-hydroxylacyl-ACP dehydratase